MTDVIHPTGKCGVLSCMRDSSRSLVYAEGPNGRRLCVASSTVMNGWTMRPGYTFCGWHERCGPCSLEEIDVLERVHWRRENGDKPNPFARRHDQEPFRSVRSREDFCAFFGVRSVGEALGREVEPEHDAAAA